MEDSHALLEVLLQNHDEQNNIARVLSVDISAATKKGDNYLSEVKRIKMNVVLKSGRCMKRSLIVKNLPPTEYQATITQQMGVFPREIMMYRDITPKLEDIMLEFNDYTEPLWAKLIDYKTNEKMVFQDLAESGYKMAQRKKGLDLEHCVLTVRCLAKLHTVSIIAKERGLIPLDIFTNHAFKSQSIDKMIEGFYAEGLKNLIKIMENTWEPEWKPIIEKLKTNILPRIVELAFDNMMYDEKAFNVLNHGDCWVNNMLFKYGIDSVTPISLKFVDFQLSFYTSPAYDLQYFLATSPNLKVRQQSLDYLLEVYYDALTEQLKDYNYKGTIISFDQLKQDYHKKSLFGLMTAVMLVPFLFRDETDESFPELEDIAKQMYTDNKVLLPECGDPMYNVVMKEILTSVHNNNKL